MKISEKLKLKLPCELLDARGNVVYFETETNFWCIAHYDDNDNQIYNEDSTGFYVTRIFNERNQEIYYEDSHGTIVDKRDFEEKYVEFEIRSKKIQEAKSVLKDTGFSIDNLWSINDVYSVVVCNEKEAHDIMHNALTDEAVMEHIWDAIKDYALINKFKLKNDSSF